MDPQTLLNEFIVPALKHLDKLKPGMDTPAARQLLVATAAQESHCGKYWRQWNNGPAQGPWQIEPDTHHDLYANYLDYRGELKGQLAVLLPIADIANPLISCPVYSAAVARLLYYRVPHKLPQPYDREGMWAYYKSWFNTPLGAATKAEWDINWSRYVERVDLGEIA